MVDIFHPPKWDDENLEIYLEFLKLISFQDLGPSFMVGGLGCLVVLEF